MDFATFLEIDAVLAAVILLFGSLSVIKQGHVGVSVLFGRYRRILRPGLNFRIPFMEWVFKKITLQHRSAELEFQAITSDQANVNFKALIIYAVGDEREETIKRAAFKFVDDRCFMQSLVRSIEGSIRAFVASKRQAEILGLRREIVDEVNAQLQDELRDWGYQLINLQINDISFDEAIMRSMAQVVATNNMKAAAENEAQAQFISKTRVAEAEAQAKRVMAEAERDAEILMADGVVESGRRMTAQGLDHSFMLYTMWLDAMKFVAEHSQGNILSFDGSMEGFEKTVKQMALLGGHPPAAPVRANDTRVVSRS